jgi:hypothetical protein
MRRNLLLLAVMSVAVLLFSSQALAQCNEDANDLGICDTIYFMTCEGHETYEAEAGFDSVSLGIFITHDSNTFYWETESKWVQDSIAAFVIPLAFTSVGCADSVVCPNWNNWNNGATSPYDPRMNRSIFRDGCNGEANRMGWLAAQFMGLEWSTIIIDIDNDTSTISGVLTPPHVFLSMIPSAPTNRRWWEGSGVLLATVDFLIYFPDEGCDTSEICIDSTFWPPASHLTFTRHDAVVYYPRHFLPVCDTIYIVPCLGPNITCPSAESQGCSGTYVTTTSFNADDGNPGDPLVNITALQVLSTTGAVTGATLVNVTGGVGQKTATGDISYTVDHCQASGTVVLQVTNNCAPPKTAQCTFNVTCTNAAPQITCPGNVTGPYHTTLVSGDFVATDECPGVVPTVTISNVTPTPTNAPAIVGNHVEWNGVCDETITITLTATDDCQATATCQFTMTSTNQGPSCVVDLPAAAPAGITIDGDFTYADPNNDVVSIVAGTVTCGAVHSIVDNGDGTGTFKYDTPDEAGDCTVCLVVTDFCGLTSECCADIEITTEPFNQVKIPNKVYERFGFEHWDYDGEIWMDDACEGWFGINPGDFFEIPIILRNFEDYVEIGGFELEVEFDYIDLTFYGAMRGILLEQRDFFPTELDTFFSWEYFAYRVLPCPLCACCKYKILLYGQAEMPDGLMRKGYCLSTANDWPSTFWDEDVVTHGPYAGQVIGATLVWLKFQAANNELLRDLKLPIFFEWEHKLYPDRYEIWEDWDCAENTMSNCDGNILYVSNNDLDQYDPDVCPSGEGILQILYFVDGGVHICSPCTSFYCVRGDINLNEIAYETADAVLFARYFVYGLGVFIIDRDNQVCGTDVNADGRTLMLADLIYLIRVIQRDAVPFSKLSPSADVANVVISDGRISVECASEIGGLLFEFDAAVTPSLLADMELIANDGKVLVWSSEGNSISAGISDVMTFAGAELVSVIAVDREGRDLATTVTAKVAPSAFALHPAYPNPFNPYTNMSFSLPNAAAYRLNVYNVAGQLVRSYEGMGVAGLNVITWDGKDKTGSDVSSGVYFFSVAAGPHKATAKMVLMK